MLRRIFTGIVLSFLVTSNATAKDFQKGLAAYNLGNYTIAYQELRPVAARGDAKSQYLLGLIYDNGLGVTPDHARAATWYRKAAEQGHADAQNNLGLLYASGLGVTLDHAKALNWHRRAAEQGHSGAQANLGVMYLMGRAALDEAPPPSAIGRGMAKIAPPRANGGDVRVQLGSVKTKARAEKEAGRLARIHKLLLGSLEIRLIRADLGSRGVYYRLRVGPFPDRATADSLCRKLSARQQNCIVVKP